MDGSSHIELSLRNSSSPSGSISHLNIPSTLTSSDQNSTSQAPSIAATTAKQEQTPLIPDGSRRRRVGRSTGSSLLHSIGLKSFTSKKFYRTRKNAEKEKVVVATSRRIAVARLAVHILPCAITVFLLAFNAVAFVNGPDINTRAKYLLQGGSKIHELSIVGSLAAVIFDILRYKLIHDGLEYGLVSSAFTFFGLNFLWSQEFFIASRNVFRKPSKAPFILFLVLCCLLAATVGPASALLCLPSQAWLSTGSTEFYIVGDEDQLWPQHLTANHTGPDWCSRGDSGDYFCPQGGWNIMRGFVTPEGTSRRTVNMVDAGTARTMWLWRNDDGNSDVGPLGTDSWALTIHGASAYIATRMKAAHDHAWNFAQGKQRRLRDATVSGMYARITGRVPVVRTVCAPFKLLNSTSDGLLFPVLEADKYWRMDSAVGPVKEILQQAFHESRVNATWVKLPAEFGPSTAGLAFITRNDTGTTVGCGCSVDARWAKGHSALHGDSITWQAFVGPPTLPAGVKFADPERMSFFEPLMKDNVGSTITADSEWLRSLSPQFPTTTVLLNTTETKTNFTSFESILLNTRLWDLPWLLSDTSNPIQQMEAVVSAYFVNALSRVGWEPQRDSKSENPNPILTVGSSDNDHLLHDGGEIWARPKNVPTVAVKQEWFNYATAWQLNESALYLSVAILAVHLVIVFCHVLFVIWMKQSSESWNSISELIALAYRSQPEQNTLENCGAGIMLSETLGREVKVVAVGGDSEDGVQKVQLVPCNSHKTKPSAREIGTAVQADTEYA